MFGGPPEQPSEAELQEANRVAGANVQLFAITCTALWFSPHVVDWARKLF
ncbi:uncharacterized protein HMPREF1541_10312 [Cyphellophora europaea CBS 101466]|uniref:Mitochondrial outer membrane translocase complex, subunit Tom5 n=1 Tax=Cyphellophora europaea (strain CBS 101466) TaxID=1220924 RepID=W2S7H9_CYPE1|nr:uncharacterized protein HMPREF1541_10312 [Cyphellophora europaea CBS 101466]ETN44642.1 hypothetical protein HMPREF1541_10312 [Cyphellophora europaea CBS 101466]